MGHSARWAAAFVGLNPVLLVLALGEEHNDTLVMLALAAALPLTAGASPQPTSRRGCAGGGRRREAHRRRGAPVPDPRLARSLDRLAAALAAALTLRALAALGLIGFGSHALGFLDAIGEQQQLVATHAPRGDGAACWG